MKLPRGGGRERGPRRGAEAAAGVPARAARSGPRPSADPAIVATGFVASANRPIRLQAAGGGPRLTERTAPRPTPRPPPRAAFCPGEKGGRPRPPPARARAGGDLEGVGPPGAGAGRGGSWPGRGPTYSRWNPGLRPSPHPCPAASASSSPPAPRQPRASGPGAWRPAPLPAPRAQPRARPPRRPRGLTRQGEHRVVRFAAHQARALRDAFHPQPLVHGLGRDDVVARVRAHLPLRDGGARHQAHPAQQSQGEAQELQARIGHVCAQRRLGTPGGRPCGKTKLGGSAPQKHNLQWRLKSPKDKFLGQVIPNLFITQENTNRSFRRGEGLHSSRNRLRPSTDGRKSDRRSPGGPLRRSRRPDPNKRRRGSVRAVLALRGPQSTPGCRPKAAVRGRGSTAVSGQVRADRCVAPGYM